MGKPDMAMKNFIEIPDVFSQLFNVAVFDGKEEVRPESLCPANPVLDAAVETMDSQLEFVERTRDVVKISDFGVAFRVILGVEDQVSVHYYMPVRDMLMDAMEYDRQCRQAADEAVRRGEKFDYAEGVPKGTKIMPTITLVLYIGTKEWDGPRQLYDMFGIPEDRREWARSYVQNYRMNLLDVRHMGDEHLNQFSGDLKAFLSALSSRYNENMLKGIVAKYRETWYAISAVKHDDRYVEYINTVSDEELAGGVNMDAVLDCIEARGERQGEKRGKKTGVRIGIDAVSQLYRYLTADGRLSDWDKALDDRDFQMKLLEEYGLLDED